MDLGKRREQDVKRGDDMAPGSWLRRARVEDRAQQVAQGTPKLRESVQSDPSEIGWDPYEVWLRRVHLPRQRREG